MNTTPHTHTQPRHTQSPSSAGNTFENACRRPTRLRRHGEQQQRPRTGGLGSRRRAPQWHEGCRGRRAPDIRPTTRLQTRCAPTPPRTPTARELLARAPDSPTRPKACLGGGHTAARPDQTAPAQPILPSLGPAQPWAGPAHEQAIHTDRHPPSARTRPSSQSTSVPRHQPPHGPPPRGTGWRTDIRPPARHLAADARQHRGARAADDGRDSDRRGIRQVGATSRAGPPASPQPEASDQQHRPSSQPPLPPVRPRVGASVGARGIPPPPITQLPSKRQQSTGRATGPPNPPGRGPLADPSVGGCWDAWHVSTTDHPTPHSGYFQLHAPPPSRTHAPPCGTP